MSGRPALPHPGRRRSPGPTARLAALATLFSALPVPLCTATDPLDDAGNFGINVSEPPADLGLATGGQQKARALSLYFKGYRLQDARDYDGAIAAYREVLELDPGNLTLADRASSLLARRGEFPDALAVLEQALEKNPRNPAAYLNLAEHCATYHNGNESIKTRAVLTAREATEKFPTFAPPYRFLVRLFLEDAKREKAREVIERALAQQTADPGFWLSLGRAAQGAYPYRFGEDDVRKSNLAKVTTIYERALHTPNTTDSTRSRIADFYAATKQYGDATSLYKKLVAARPDDLDTREKLAQVYRIQQRHDDALATFEDLVRIDPFNARIREKVSGYAAEQGRLKTAATHLLEAIKLGKNSPENFGNAIDLLLRTGQIEEAVRTTERAAFLYPRNPVFPLQLATIHRRNADYAAARAQYETVEELAKNALSKEDMDRFLNFSFYFNYGAAVERTKDFDTAADLFRKSIDLTPEEAPELAAGAYNYLGYMWLENGINIDEAGELIIYANELEPENSAYVDSLGWFYFVKGEHQKALDELLRAADLLGKEYDAAFDEALGNGLVQEADRSPDRGADPVVLDHVAQAYHALGKTAEAVATLEKAVALEGVTEDVTARLEEYRKLLDAAPAKTPADPDGVQ